MMSVNSFELSSLEEGRGYCSIWLRICLSYELVTLAEGSGTISVDLWAGGCSIED